MLTADQQQLQHKPLLTKQSRLLTAPIAKSTCLPLLLLLALLLLDTRTTNCRTRSQAYCKC